MKESKEKTYVEILGDTVSPNHVILSIMISLILGLGGFFIGKRIFPGIADQQMVNSYSLLLGIVGCVIALIVCALLFHPKRILTEDPAAEKNSEELLRDLGVHLEEENDVISTDPVTRKEMEELGIKDIFTAKESVTKQ